MPLDRFVLIIVGVIAAAGATIWLATLLFVSLNVGPILGLAVLIPISLVVYVAWRIISDRLSNSEDDHYDRIEK